MSVGAQAARSTDATLRSALTGDRYIVSAGFDWLFFIGSPLVAIAVVLGAATLIQPAAVSAAVLTYMAIGHHIPTFWRAYADPEEFARNRFRLVSLPLLVLPLIALLYQQGSGLIGLVFVWDQYHFVRQHYGFMRIYDAKAGHIAKGGAFTVDQLFCFALFLCIISHSDYYSYVYALGLFDYGALLPSWGGPLLRSVSLGATAVTGTLFALDLYRRFASGDPIARPKLAITATTYGTWHFAYVALADPFLSYAISSFFHCLQYDALAWVYNHKKAQTMAASPRGALFRYVHGRSGHRVWLYIASILAYGLLAEAGHVIAPSHIVVLTLSTGLLHYYYDSFIWRVRRPEFRQHLS
jgi:hypothetical protein